MGNTMVRLSNTLLGSVLVAGLGGFLLGYVEVIVNGAAVPMRQSLALTESQLGLVVAAAPIGAVLTGLFSSQLAGSIGRVHGMQLAALAFLGSFVGSAFSAALPSLLTWRLLGGIGIGLASIVVPAYLTEIAPARIRGRICSVMYCAIGLGIFFALAFEALIALAVPDSDPLQRLGMMQLWRWMLFSGSVPSLFYLFVLPSVPESPRVLVRQRRIEEARRVFRSFGAQDPDQVVEQVKTSLEFSGSQKSSALSIWQLLTLPIVWCGILLACFQQFNGINAVFYYSTLLWRSIGLSAKDSLFWSLITAVVNVLATLITVVLVERMGRKRLLLLGSCGMTISLMAMAIGLRGLGAIQGIDQISGASSVVVMLAVNLFVLAFGCSWGPVLWILLGELFSNLIRDGALGVSVTAKWLATILISLGFPLWLKQVGPSLPFACFAAFSLISLIFVLIAVPETRGRELEQIG